MLEETEDVVRAPTDLTDRLRRSTTALAIAVDVEVYRHHSEIAFAAADEIDRLNAHDAVTLPRDAVEAWFRCLDQDYSRLVRMIDAEMVEECRSALAEEEDR